MYWDIVNYFHNKSFYTYDMERTLSWVSHPGLLSTAQIDHLRIGHGSVVAKEVSVDLPLFHFMLGFHIFLRTGMVLRLVQGELARTDTAEEVRKLFHWSDDMSYQLGANIAVVRALSNHTRMPTILLLSSACRIITCSGTIQLFWDYTGTIWDDSASIIS